MKKALQKDSAQAALLISAVIMLVLLIDVVVPVYPNDLWPYMRIGQEIIRTHAIPTTEFMTYTQYGQPAQYLYWLPSLIFLGVYNLGGITLISVMSAACLGLYYFLLWRSLKHWGAGKAASAVVLLLSIITTVSAWSVKPQLLVLPLFGLALLALARWQQRDNRLLWCLPLISFLWVNLHGSFIILFLLAIPAVLFGKGNKKKLLLFTAIALLATLLNYYGPGVWKGMFSMVNSQSIHLYSIEWQAPVNSGWRMNIFFLLLLAIPILASFSKAKAPFLLWVWYVGFGFMALTSVRYNLWFAAVEMTILALLLDPIISSTAKRVHVFQNRKLNIALSVVLLLLPAAFLPSVRSLWWQNALPTYQETTPVQAVEWLKEHPELKGKMWSSFDFATYLNYALPERPQFMSNRFEDFPLSQHEENTLIETAAAGWETVLDKYDVNLVMVYQSGDRDLAAALENSSQWQELYRDDAAAIFARK